MRGSPGPGRVGSAPAARGVSVTHSPTPCASPEPDSPANGSHQGTTIPCSRRHKSMISNGDGGPARTRTWDQGIMSNRISSILLPESRRSLNAFPVSLPSRSPDRTYPERSAEIRECVVAENLIGHIELRVRTDRAGPNCRDRRRGVVGGGVSRE